MKSPLIYTKPILIATLLTLSMVFLSPIVRGAVGVKAGDWARYTIDVTLPEGEEMGDFTEFQDIEWIEGRVENVSSDTVTGTLVLHYANGTEVEEEFSDVIGTSELPFFIEPNLGIGDSVPLEMFEENMQINGTETRSYAGATREVNYVRLSLNEFGINSSVESYWDRETGLLCELGVSISGEIFGESLSMSMAFLLVETNIWTVPSGFLGVDYVFWILPLAVAIVGVVAVLVIRLR